MMPKKPGKRGPPNGHFIMLPHAVYDSPEFKVLSPTDIAVLLLLIRKHNGRNNGAISLGLTEAATRCRCSRPTALRALNNLQGGGLLKLIHKGHAVAQFGRPNVASRWRLNFVTEAPRKMAEAANHNQ
jgi:hypothetical protein